MKVGLVYDLRKDYLAEGCSPEEAAEFDSEETIDALDRTVRALGHETERVGHGRALCKRLAAGDRWDMVFNIAEGMHGRSREAQVPCILEMYGIPCTFSDALVCAATLDKSIAKRLVHDAGLPTPRFAVVRDEAGIRSVSLRYPLFAKPLAEGTGKGIDSRSRIDTPERLADACRTLLRQFGQPVLVEEFLPGREFTVGVTGTGSAACVLGGMEILFAPNTVGNIYSFETKENWESYVRYEPLPDGPFEQQVKDLALDCHRALECRDASRVDIRCDGDGRPCFMEVNPLPGLHPTHSDLPIIASLHGVTYMELIGSIIKSATCRLVRT